MIPAQGLGQVELTNLADLSRDTGPVQIERLNRQRNVTILSNLQTGKPLGGMKARLADWARNLKLSGVKEQPSGHSEADGASSVSGYQR